MKKKFIKPLIATCLCLAVIAGIVLVSDKKVFSNEKEDKPVVVETIEIVTEEDVEEETEEVEIIDEVETEEKSEVKVETNKTSNQPSKVEQPVVTELEVQPEIVEPEQIEGGTSYTMPSTSGFKSYMSYKAITSTSSPQYKLQHSYAYTGDYGIRQVNGRYCIAIGTFSGASIGTYVDLILNNGTTIHCIIGDFKSNAHTDASNMMTSNGCVSEFIVDMNSFNSTAK